MRKSLLILTAFLFLGKLFSVQNWQSYTSLNNVYQVAKSDQDKIIVSTWGGIIYFDLITEEFINSDIVDSKLDKDIKCIDFIDAKDELLLGSNNSGVYRYLADEESVTLNADIGLSSEKVNCITHFEENIYVATPLGLSVFKEIEDFAIPLLINTYTSQDGLSDENVKKIQIAGNYLYCMVEDALDYVHVDSLAFSSAWGTIPLHTTNISLNDFFIKENRIIIGTDKGLMSSIDAPEFNDISFIFEAEINNKSIFPVYIDSTDDIWFGFGKWNDANLNIEQTGEYVIAKIHENSLELYANMVDEYLTKQIYSINEINSKIILSTWGEGLLILDEEGWKKFKPNCIMCNYVKDMEITDKGVLWVVNGFEGDYLSSGGTKGVSTFDGSNWVNYSSKDSPLRSDNLYSINVDSQGRVWLGAWYTNEDGPNGWKNGITIIDPLNSDWYALNRSGFLHFNEENNTWQNLNTDYIISSPVVGIESDGLGNTFIGCSGEGVFVFNDESMNRLDFFQLGDISVPRGSDFIFTDENMFIGDFFSGLRYWNSREIPVSELAIRPTPSDISGTGINDLALFDNQDGKQLFIASNTALYMYDFENWHKYDTDVKRKIYEGGWENDQLYVVSQTRLYGSELTSPTALFADPFERIWIGTKDNGITLFTPDESYENEFKVYNTENSPLLSDWITSFAYDPVSGVLYIGTINGVNSVEIGRSVKTKTSMKETIVYPNPFYPEKGEKVHIVNGSNGIFPLGENSCSIYDLSGELVITLSENDYYQFDWNGQNQAGGKCAAGVYFYVVSCSAGEADKGTIVLMR